MKPIVLMWENLGPMHADRCSAVASQFKGKRRVIVIELGGRSNTYQWERIESDRFERVTLFPDKAFSEVNPLYRTWAFIHACMKIGPAYFFFCHYEYASSFLVAILLRILRRRVFIMNDSKFDDKPRRIYREMLKKITLAPYNGAMAGSKRSAAYLRFLGFSRRPVVLGYDTLSTDRIRTQAHTGQSQTLIPFASRHFTVIARLVEKKNLFTTVDAYFLYVQKIKSARQLHICGSGPLEHRLKEKVVQLGLENFVIFHGQTKSESISRILLQTLAMILVSNEEQFGLVIAEAQAMHVPVIFSANCGARDELLRTGVNGYMVEADNPKGIAYFMQRLSERETEWEDMIANSRSFAAMADATRFGKACEELILA